MIPESVTAASESLSINFTEKLTNVKQDDTLTTNSEYEMQSKAKVMEDGKEVKPDHDGVFEDFCLANLFEDQQQCQHDEGKDKDNDADAFFPLKHSTTITTVGSPAYDDDDDDGGIVYYYNEPDPLQAPPPVIMSDPTGMVISANNFSKEEIEDPTLLDSSFEMEDQDYDIYKANNHYATSNINQIIRIPSVDGRYSNRVIERTPSGTSSVSFSCPSLTSASSSASSIDSCMDGSTCTSGSGSDGGSGPISSTLSMCRSVSDLSAGNLSPPRGNTTASLVDGNTTGSSNDRRMIVTQADVVDMGAGAVAILSESLMKGSVSDVVFWDNAAGSTRQNRLNNGEVDDDELMNEYLPPGLLTPPRVDRRVALADLLRAADRENDQDDDDIQEEESAYLPSGLCLPSIDKTTNPLPSPPRIKKMDEELLVEYLVDSSALVTPLRGAERENDQDDDDAMDVENTHLPSRLCLSPGQEQTKARLLLVEDTVDSSDDPSCAVYNPAHNLPYDELLCSPTDEPPSLHPNSARRKSCMQLTIDTDTTLNANGSSLQCKVFTFDPDATSTCSSDHTHYVSNCSPPHPIALDDTIDVCSDFFWHDCFLSILDCPGRRTRKKREKRQSKQLVGADSFKRKGKGIRLIKGLQLPRRGGKKVSKMMQFLRQGKDVENHNAGAGIVGGHRWGESLVNDAISRMRSANRLGQGNEGDEQNLDVDSPKLGRRKRGESCHDDGSRSYLNSDGSSLLERSEDSEIRRWERRALKHLKKMEFKEALSTYQKILDSYQSHINQCKLVNRAEAEYEPYVGTIMHNIGVIYLLNQQYDLACKSLREASDYRSSCIGKHHMDYISSISRTGLAYYAQDKFFEAREMWQDALTLLRQLPISPLSSSNTSAELSVVLNNLACAEFEIGEIKNSARTFLEALDLYRNGGVTTEAENRQYEGYTAWKLAILRSNVGYIWLRMKNADAAIIAFEAALVDQNKFSYHGILTISMLDHLILALLRKGKKHGALKVCSQMLKLQIENYGPSHTECEQTMTKIKLLENGLESACSKNRLQSTADKVKGCCVLVDNGNTDQHRHYQEERQLERFEKLLKAPNTWNRISFTPRNSFL